MQDKVVFAENKVPFFDVDWGRTKVLIGNGAEAVSDKVMMKITEYLPGYVHKKHIHPKQEEIIFVLSGKGYTESASGKREIVPGDVVFIPAGLEHATYNPFEDTLRVVIVKAPPDKN